MSHVAVELSEIEPIVVDLTISDDYPEFSVRMPLLKLVDMHDAEYLEIRYRRLGGVTNIQSTMLPSPVIMKRMALGQASQPMSLDLSVGSLPGLGRIEHVLIAVSKLAEYHREARYVGLFTKYPAS